MKSSAPQSTLRHGNAARFSSSSSASISSCAKTVKATNRDMTMTSTNGSQMSDSSIHIPDATEIALLLAVWDVISQEQRDSAIGLLAVLQGLAERDETDDTDLRFANLLATLGSFLRSNGDTELHLDNVSQFLEILPSLNARAVRGLLTRVDGRPPPEYVVQDDNGNPPEDMSEVTSSISSSAFVRDVAMLQPL